jgi:peptidylprolyl isomerase/FKBP-type peptidyl-prolyl cis-trans isomerase FklB
MVRRHALWAAALVSLSLTAACATASRPVPPPAYATPEEQAFLPANARAEGVVSLPGLQYKVLKSGPADGVHPKRSDDITVRYEGRFLDGKMFSSSPDQGAGTITFELQKLIPGWIAALQMMRPGDVWMLYVPSHLAYGKVGKSYIPPDRTLVFKVELVSVAPHVESAPAR